MFYLCNEIVFSNENKWSFDICYKNEFWKYDMWKKLILNYILDEKNVNF